MKWKTLLKQLSLQDSGLLLKRVYETIQNEVKEQKGRLLRMLLCTLGAFLLGNVLEDKGIVIAGYSNKKGKGIIRAVYGSKLDF